MEFKDKVLMDQTEAHRAQVRALTAQILNSIRGNSGAGRFAQPNLMPQQQPMGNPLLTSGSSTFPKNVFPASPPPPMQSFPPQMLQNGMPRPQMPQQMPMMNNQSIFPKTTPGLPPPFDPRFET